MDTKNDTMRYILERSSIRGYREQPLSDEQVNILKKAVLAAPTARNRQQLRYNFVTDKHIIRTIDRRIFHFCDPEMQAVMEERASTSFFYGAPLVVLITGKDTTWIDIDAGIAIQTLAIAAQSMGLSSVILGMPRLAFQHDDPENCRDLLKLEADEKFCIAIAIGYADTSKAPHAHDPSLIRDF